MITGRNVILAAIVIFVLAMIMNVISLMQPLDNRGKGRDSYGVYPSGHRAVVEVMESVDLPVARTHAPFDRRISSSATYVLVGPDVMLLEAEEGTLRQMEEWVQSGGRLVIGFVDGWPSPNFKEKFSLEEIQLTDFESQEPLYDLDDEDSDEEIPIGMRKIRQDLERQKEERGDKSLREDFGEIVTFAPPECTPFPLAECTGHFRSACETVETVALRKGENVALDTGETSPVSVLKIQGPKGPRTLIAEYERGEGSVILVSDVSLFDNLSLREGDNSVLLVNLLSEGRDLVVFDEFFHGLSIRGNPMWVFVQPGYRIIVLMLLGTVVLFVWHELPAFGIVPPPEKSPRRTLEIYLDAVSRLLLRTRSQRPQLLAESKEAFLWRMARKLHLAGERNQLESIRSRLKRIDAETLQQFDSIIAEYGRCQWEGCSSKELLALLQRSHRCLS